jgi:hypothetical protein
VRSPPVAPTRRPSISPISISIVIPKSILLGRAWKLRDNVNVYDAMYVALAEAIEATIVTCDVIESPRFRVPRSGFRVPSSLLPFGSSPVLNREHEPGTRNPELSARSWRATHHVEWHTNVYLLRCADNSLYVGERKTS